MKGQKNMKKTISIILFCILFIMIGIVPIFAINDTVPIALPSFSINLNGQNIDNSYNRYPLILYKGITYFPMTYYDCRFLGLETVWNDESKQLEINTTNINGTYHENKQKIKNNKSYYATVVDYKILVNGKVIDNSKEEYPLLSFRDITYFPMTWKFCVNEFKWQYSFDEKNGFSINSANKKVSQIGKLPNQANDEVRNKNVVITDSFVYYEANNGYIMRAKLSDLTKTEILYQLPIDKQAKQYCRATLLENNDKVYLYYFKDELANEKACYLSITDNTSKFIDEDISYNTIDTNSTKFRYKMSNETIANNLYMKLPNTDEWKNIGNQSLSYGNKTIFDYYDEYNTNSFYYDNKQYVYIIGIDTTKNDIEHKPGIYRIDINTNETKRLVDEDLEVTDFCYSKGYLYYHNYFVDFFQYNVLSEQTNSIPPYFEHGNNYVNSFVVLDDIIYNTNQFSLNIFYMTDIDTGFMNQIDNNSTACTSSLQLKGNNKEYIVCTFNDTAFSNYRIVVFNQGGNVIFKTADSSMAKNVRIIGKKLYYYNWTTKTVCVVGL